MSNPADRPPLRSPADSASVAVARQWEIRLGEIGVKVGFRATTIVPAASPSNALTVWEWEGGRTD